MSESSIKLIASVRQRLLNGARERNEDFQLTLTRYAIERLLYRLSQSPLRNEFILKGASLYAVWSMENQSVLYRPTRDVDFWSAGNPSIERLVTAFHEIVTVAVEPDGLVFDSMAIRGSVIREDERYEGCRLHLTATLGTATIPLQVDIGFGDAITPSAQEEDYPTLLLFPKPRLRIYPRETVVAEKFEAMVSLGFTNSRMKDFFDIWLLCERFAFDGTTLSRALMATFACRDTLLPIKAPLSLTTQFSQDGAKIAAWRAFTRRNTLNAPELSIVTEQIRNFLMPPSQAAISQKIFMAQWQPGGDWINET